MAHGALRRNKKMRKGNNIGDKVKILSGEEIRFDRIRNMINSGCTVVLHNFRDNEDGIAYDSSMKEKTIYVTFKSERPNYFSDATLKFFNANSYEIVQGRKFEIRDVYPALYKELNEKVQKLL